MISSSFMQSDLQSFARGSYFIVNGQYNFHCPLLFITRLPQVSGSLGGIVNAACPFSLKEFLFPA